MALPGRVVHRRADVEQRGEGQQRPRRDVAEEGKDRKDADRGQHPGLPEDEQLAAVEDVGRGAREQAENENREATRPSASGR